QERRGPAEVGGQLHPIAFAQQSGDSAADLTPRPEAMLPAAQADGTNAPLPLQLQTRPFETMNVVHQPLIQVKMRVVEVSRNDTLQVASVLDFVGLNPHPNSSLITGNNINNNMRNISGATRFSVVPPDLIGISGTMLSAGSGALVNLTTG